MLDTWKCGATAEHRCRNDGAIAEDHWKGSFRPRLRRQDKHWRRHERRRRYIDYVFSSVFLFPEYWPSRGNRNIVRASALIEGTIDQIVQERRASATPQGEPSHDEPVPARHDCRSFFRRGVETAFPSAINRCETRRFELFLAGYETVGHSLAWTCYLLSQHPRLKVDLWRSYKASSVRDFRARMTY
jgi:cytochrome P450